MKNDDINKWSWSVLEQYCKDDSTDVDFNEYEVKNSYQPQQISILIGIYLMNLNKT
jgi:hypothetical protein